MNNPQNVNKKMISWTEIINDDNKYIIPKIISSITILVYTT